MKGWWKESKDHSESVLWIQYEDVKNNPSDEIRKVAAFLNIAHDDDIVQKVAVASCFDSMKIQADKIAGETVDHLRKGTTGDWENHFTPTLLQEFKSKYETEMNGVGVEYNFCA